MLSRERRRMFWFRGISFERFPLMLEDHQKDLDQAARVLLVFLYVPMVLGNIDNALVRTFDLIGLKQPRSVSLMGALCGFSRCRPLLVFIA